MPYKQAIVLKVMTKANFVSSFCLLLLMVLFSALLSPYPYILIVTGLSVTLLMWKLDILKFSKVNDTELTLIIFPDGLLRLESTNGMRLDGVLDGQQWSTQSVAILRFEHETGIRNVVVLSGQQKRAGDFRRLTVMLRHNFYNRSESKLVTGV